MFRLLTSDVYQLLRLVVVEPSVAAYLNIDKHIGLYELCHEERVLTNHHRTDAREHGIVVEVEIVGNQFVYYLSRQRSALLALLD